MIRERRFTLLGYRFRFRTNAARAEALLSTLYEDDPSSAAGGDLYELHEHAERGAEWRVAVGASPPHAYATFGAAMNAIEASIADALARCDTGRHVIHAATVYAPQGDLLLTGESGAGKTTLSLALTARGLRVGGDDTATLDPVTNTVLPVPRCFHIDERSAALLAQAGVTLPADALEDEFVTPAHLGVVQPPPARIRFVFLLERERLATPRIVPDTQAHTIATLLMQTGRGHFTDRQALDALSRLTGDCRCFRLWSASLQTTTDEVVQLVRS
jgi:hypothetical protein